MSTTPPRAQGGRNRACVPLAASLAFAVAAVAAVRAAAEQPVVPPTLPAWMLLFGDEHDPNRPVPPVPQPKGKGIVAATVVTAGDAQVLEYQGAARQLTAVAVDVRLEAGSTTADLTAASVRARRGRHAAGADAAAASDVGMLGACVLSKDPTVELTVIEGTGRAGWTVHVGDREFVCAGAAARLAILGHDGSFRLGAAPGAEAGARLLLVFEVPAADVSTVVLPGVTLALPGEAKP